jgi:hypothetical protein
LLAFIIAAEQSSVETPNNKEGLKVHVELEDDCCFESEGSHCGRTRMEDDAANKKSSSTGF